MSKEGRDEENSFKIVLKSLNLPEWFGMILNDIWELNRVRESWTYARITDLIKNLINDEEEKVRLYMEEVISNNEDKEED